jgi:hypothetical protein
MRDILVVIQRVAGNKGVAEGFYSDADLINPHLQYPLCLRR